MSWVWRVKSDDGVKNFFSRFAFPLSSRSTNKRGAKRGGNNLFEQEKNFSPPRLSRRFNCISALTRKTYNLIHCHSSDADERILEIGADLCVCVGEDESEISLNFLINFSSWRVRTFRGAWRCRRCNWQHNPLERWRKKVSNSSRSRRN